MAKTGSAGNVRVRWNRTLDEVLGDASGVTGARIKDVKTGTTEDLSAMGVFIAIGHTPNTGIFEGQLAMAGGSINRAPIAAMCLALALLPLKPWWPQHP